MISVRKSKDRGTANHGWLKTFHTFSFAAYFDPANNKFRALRVINEDWIRGGEGFGTHPHENMEILTYVIEGELEHKDSMGNGAIIRRGELQRLTAGTGIVHSEFNLSNQNTHLLQIWIYPERSDLEPGYEKRAFAALRNPNTLVLLASQTGRENSLTVHQDIELHGGTLDADNRIEYEIPSRRHAWVQIVEGKMDINGTALDTGDGAAVSEEKTLRLTATTDCEFLLFDLA